ncbi:hypothetical protein ABTB60_19090, partial [Acinetobacter baumannii]
RTEIIPAVRNAFVVVITTAGGSLSAPASDSINLPDVANASPASLAEADAFARVSYRNEKLDIVLLENFPDFFLNRFPAHVQASLILITD